MKSRYLIFLSVFFSVYGLENAYVLSRLFTLLSVEMPLLYYLLLFYGTFSFVFAYTLESRCNNRWSKIVYSAAAFWMGFLTIYFGVLLLHHVFVWITGYSTQWLDWFVVGLGFSCGFYAYCNAHGYCVTRHTLQSSKVKKKMRIVQISDLHLGPIKKEFFLHKLIEKINKQHPDFVVISGDLVDGPGKLPDHLLDPLNEIKAPTIYSIGNHERYVGLEVVNRLLSKSKVQLLRNGKQSFDQVEFIGIDDADNKEQVKHVLSRIKLSKEKFTVLSYHRPWGMKDAQEQGVDLMFCGHTHAGQIIPFNFLVKKSFKYIKGKYKFGPMTLYVNPGTGTWGPPMRIGSHNEVVVFDVLPQ